MQELSSFLTAPWEEWLHTSSHFCLLLRNSLRSSRPHTRTPVPSFVLLSETFAAHAVAAGSHSFCDPFTRQALMFLLAFSAFHSPSCNGSLHLTPRAPSGPVTLRELKIMVNKQVKTQILSVTSRTNFRPFKMSELNQNKLIFYDFVFRKL